MAVQAYTNESMLDSIRAIHDMLDVAATIMHDNMTGIEVHSISASVSHSNHRQPLRVTVRGVTEGYRTVTVTIQ